MVKPPVKSERKETEGVQAATIAARSRAHYERIIYNPQSSWRDIRKILPMFMDEAKVRAILRGIRKIQNAAAELGYELQPRDCINFIALVEDTYYKELQQRAQYGKSGISTVGWLSEDEDTTEYDIHRLGTGFLVYNAKGGQDYIWLGDREYGKSDGNLHYVVEPRLVAGHYVSSGVKIDNPKAWPRYLYGVTDVDLLLNAVKVTKNSLKEQEDFDKEDVKIPATMLVRDDVATVVSRKRATAEELFNLECLGFIARHFGLITVWIFQYYSTVPTSIREMCSRWFIKTKKKTMTSTIQWPGQIEYTHLKGLIGRNDRKKQKMNVLDYFPERPMLTTPNLVMADVMMWCNYKERELEEEGGLTLLALFSEVEKYLTTVVETMSVDKGITREQILLTLSWLYVTGKRDNDYKYVKLTYKALGNIAYEWGVTPRMIETTVGKIIQDRNKNPGRWIPIPENKKEQLEAVRKLMDKHLETPEDEEDEEDDTDTEE